MALLLARMRSVLFNQGWLPHVSDVSIHKSGKPQLMVQTNNKFDRLNNSATSLQTFRLNAEVLSPFLLNHV